MTHPNWLAAGLIAVGLSGPVQTQDGFIKTLELSAHERLQTVREAEGVTLAPFTTDGCSGNMSATWRLVARMFPGFNEIHQEEPPWEACCVVHDRAYHLGGEDAAPEASYDARLIADEALRQCVRDTSGARTDVLKQEYDLSEDQIEQAFELISASMFDAVRFGGGPCSGLPWRWGYGWPACNWLSGN